MKKIISLMLAVLLVFSVIPLMSLSAASTFEIVSAIYGSATEKIDVTDIIAGKMSNGVLPEFTVSDETMGCTPNKADGEINRLVVCYKENGVKEYFCVAEGSNAALPFMYDPEQSAETQAILAETLATSTAEKVWPEDGVRGFNFGGTIGSFNANPGCEGKYVTEETFKYLKSIGVNVLRIPIASDTYYDWSTDTIPADDPVAPYRHHLEGLKVALKLAEKYNIWIIPSGDNVVGRKIDIMYNEADGSGYNATLKALWTYIATNFGSHPRLLAYDLLNEPNTDNDSEYYLNTVLPELVSTIRAIDTNTYLVVEPAKFAMPNAFSSLQPIDDEKTVYSFHYYFPHQYTHQGLGDYETEFTYPSEMGNFPTDAPIMWDKATIESTVEAVKTFQAEYNAKIFIGEFGTVRWANGADQWIKDCIDIWEENGWSWAYHSYGGYDGFNPTFDAESTPSNVMDGGVDTESLKTLKEAFKNNKNSFPPVIVETSTNAQEVKDFAIANVDNNLLKGIVPTYAEENTGYTDFVHGGTFTGLTDGTYNSGSDRYTINASGNLGNGIMRVTYTLPYRTNISDLLVVCRENNTGMFALTYEVYVSDDVRDLYNAENLLFANAGYSSGGQRVSYLDDSQVSASFVGFRLVGSKQGVSYHVGEWGIYGTKAASIPVIKETTTNATEVQDFVTENVDNNLLKGLEPNIVEEETTVDAFYYGDTTPADATDGTYNKYYMVGPTDRGNGVLRITYTLPYRTNISELVTVCRDNNEGLVGFNYEIYVSDKLDELYNAENRVFAKGTYTSGGQLVIFAEDIMPVGSFVGFRLLNATNVDNNRYHIGELGVYGTKAASNLVIKETTTNATEVQDFVTENVDNNLLKGLEPNIVEEETTVDAFYYGDTTPADATDGTYNKYYMVGPTDRGNGVLRITYTLPYRTNISELVTVCRDNNEGLVGFNYEIYVSDKLDELYNAENRVFAKGTYTSGGQLVIFAEDIMPVGSFVGFRLLNATNVDNNRYHIGELGVYGTKAASIPVIKETTTNATEVQDFVTNNVSNNLLANVEPIITEEGTDSKWIYKSGEYSFITDGNYNTYYYTAPSNFCKTGVLMYTYELPYSVKISDLLVVCRENNINNYGFDYGIYVSDNADDLYNKENLVFEKGTYSAGGQLISFAEDIQVEGSFVGFSVKSLTSEAAVAIGQFGVYGVSTEVVEDAALTVTPSDNELFEASTVAYNKDYLFKFVASSEEGYFTVEHKLTGLYLTMKDGGICLSAREEDNYYQLWKTVDLSELYGVEGVVDLVCYGEDDFAMTAIDGVLGFSEVVSMGATDGRSWILGNGAMATDGLVCTLKTYNSNNNSNYLNVTGAVWGDLNNDNERNILDLIAIKKMSLNTIEPTVLSDLNNDDILANSSDLIILKKVFFGFLISER